MAHRFYIMSSYRKLEARYRRCELALWCDNLILHDQEVTLAGKYTEHLFHADWVAAHGRVYGCRDFSS
jgi:hypothetical protein